jgi:hypothetical protein
MLQQMVFELTGSFPRLQNRLADELTDDKVRLALAE